MSQLPSPKPESPDPSWGGNVVRIGVAAAWHTACMSMVGGCLYVAPVWRPAVNLPPDIIRPEEADVREIPLVFNTSQVLVTVIASDPEQQALEFVWQTPLPDPVVNTYPQGEDAWVSVLTLQEENVVDGDEIRVTVFDDNPRGAVDVVWRVELP